MWVLVSPQGRSTGAPLVAAFPFCSTKSLPVRMTSVWKLCLIILLCATSQNAQHSQDPHDNRLVGTQRKERDACQSGYIRGWPEGDGSVHDTSVTGHRETLHPPPRRLMVVKLVRACALVWAWPVVMWNPLEVASAQDGRSIDKAGGEVRQKQLKKRSFLSPDCTVLSLRTC